MNIATEGPHTVIRFGGEIRTVLDSPLQYYQGGVLTNLQPGDVSFWLCNPRLCYGEEKAYG